MFERCPPEDSGGQLGAYCSNEWSGREKDICCKTFSWLEIAITLKAEHRTWNLDLQRNWVEEEPRIPERPYLGGKYSYADVKII